MRRVAEVLGVLGLRVRGRAVRIPGRARGRRWVVVFIRTVSHLPRSVVAPSPERPVRVEPRRPRLRLCLLWRAHGRRGLVLEARAPQRSSNSTYIYRQAHWRLNGSSQVLRGAPSRGPFRRFHTPLNGAAGRRNALSRRSRLLEGTSTVPPGLLRMKCCRRLLGQISKSAP